MKLESLDHYGIDPLKLGALGTAGAIVAGIGFELAVGRVLGSTTPIVLMVLAGLVFYGIVSSPKRVLDHQRLSQSREAVVLAVSASACLPITRSSSRSLLILRSNELGLAETLRAVGRRILLGESTSSAIRAETGRLASYSAANTLKAIASTQKGHVKEGAEELAGLTGYSELSSETRLPIFMTVCFFSPIMLLLYSVFSKSTSPASLAELVLLQVILLDLTYFVCSPKREA